MDNSKKHKNDSLVASSTTTTTTNRIPLELESKILLRLPVASLMRLACVCKRWRGIIRSPDFVSEHARRVHENKLIVMHRAYSRGFFMLPEARRFLFSPPDASKVSYSHSLVSSFDGIVCVVFYKTVDEKYVQFASLWNPTTKQSIFLPPSPESDIDESDHWETIDYGFGFDVETNAYKLVKLVVEDIFFKYIDKDEDGNGEEEEEEEEGEGAPTLKSQVSVYDLETDSWKIVYNAMPYNFRVTSNPKRPFQKKIYCWLGYDQVKKKDSILSFDFSNESFGIIALPEFKKDTESESESESDSILTFLVEDLAFVDWVKEDSRNIRYNVWVLGDYGLAESWAKLYTITLDRVHHPLGFSADGMLVLRSEPARYILLFYDPITRQGTIVSTPHEVCDVAVYKESMVCVNRATALKKRATYVDLSKAVHYFQIFGDLRFLKRVLHSRAQNDVLQKEVSRLRELVRNQGGTIQKQEEDLSEVNHTIEKQKKDLSKIKEELLKKNTQYKELYASYTSNHGLPPSSFPVPDSSTALPVPDLPGGDARTNGSAPH